MAARLSQSGSPLCLTWTPRAAPRSTNSVTLTAFPVAYAAPLATFTDLPCAPCQSDGRRILPSSIFRSGMSG